MRDLTYIDAASLPRLLPFPALIDGLADIFRTSAAAPLRHHHHLSSAGLPERELLIMPAWTADHLAVKLVTLYPENRQSGLPTITGLITLFDGATGQPLALLDAGEVTARRTAAASALAARFLAPVDAKCLLAVGSGRLIPYLVEAHTAVRRFEQVKIWARDGDQAAQVADYVGTLLPRGVSVQPVTDLERATAEADVITMATRATAPVIRGEWVKAGTHLDLIGAYRPDMCEVDDECIRRAAVC